MFVCGFPESKRKVSQSDSVLKKEVLTRKNQVFPNNTN